MLLFVVTSTFNYIFSGEHNLREKLSRLIRHVEVLERLNKNKNKYTFKTSQCGSERTMASDAQLDRN